MCIPIRGVPLSLFQGVLISGVPLSLFQGVLISGVPLSLFQGVLISGVPLSLFQGILLGGDSTIILNLAFYYSSFCSAGPSVFLMNYPSEEKDIPLKSDSDPARLISIGALKYWPTL